MSDEKIDFERWYRELFRKYQIIRDALDDGGSPYSLSSNNPFGLMTLRFIDTDHPKTMLSVTEHQYREVSRAINVEFDRLFRK